jgi:hypothetical protein
VAGLDPFTPFSAIPAVECYSLGAIVATQLYAHALPRQAPPVPCFYINHSSLAPGSRPQNALLYGVPIAGMAFALSVLARYGRVALPIKAPFIGIFHWTDLGMVIRHCRTDVRTDRALGRKSPVPAGALAGIAKAKARYAPTCPEARFASYCCPSSGPRKQRRYLLTLWAARCLVPAEGLEPPTFGLQNRCSTD